MTQVSSVTHAISINPATGEQIGHYPFESAQAQEATLTRAAAGFSLWRNTALAERAAALLALAATPLVRETHCRQR